MATVLAGFEIHAPFQHQDALEFYELVKATFKPDMFICVGDFIDGHANSRYDHDPDGFSAGAELEATIDSLEDFYEMFPEMKVCLGNHDNRVIKAAYKAGIPAKALKSIEELYNLPEGWELADHHIIDGVCYEHGDKYSGQLAHVKAASNNMRSTVIGHTHTTFGVEYIANREKLIFAANAGCMVDTHSYAMAYGKGYSKKPILGCLIIKDGMMVVPVPMLLDNKSRWVGRI
jgi:predicted phosphodiesterase